MAVLLTYHKLVERDEKAVQMHWKGEIVQFSSWLSDLCIFSMLSLPVGSMLLLILCIVFSFGVAITLHNIINVFDSRCVLGAQIKLSPVEPSQNVSTSELTSSTVDLASFLNQSYAQFIAANDQSEFPTSQAQFLVESEFFFCNITIFYANLEANHAIFIDEINLQETVWGTQSTCDYAIYIPLFQCMFSILMVVMFAICGRGGKADSNAFLPQPWRIVTPALVFNIIMTILAIVTTSLIEGGLSEFCRSLTAPMPDVSCGVAMNRFMFSSIDKVRVPPSVQRQMLTSFGIVNLIFWILAVAVLIARILFVVDFQLIRVTVKTLDPSKVKKKGEKEAKEVKEVRFDAGNDTVSKCWTRHTQKMFSFS